MKTLALFIAEFFLLVYAFIYVEKARAHSLEFRGALLRGICDDDDDDDDDDDTLIINRGARGSSKAPAANMVSRSPIR